jgi:hypothetical protein
MQQGPLMPPSHREMKRGEMTQERLEGLLSTLPALDQQCAHKIGKGVWDFCANKAVIRHPATGIYLCGRDAIEASKVRQIHKEDLEKAVRWRRFFIVNPTECTECAQPAARHCSYCEAPICEDDMVFIPRTGCACRYCNELLWDLETELHDDGSVYLDDEECYAF